MVQCVPVDSKNVRLYPACDIMQTAFYTGICLFYIAYLTLSNACCFQCTVQPVTFKMQKRNLNICFFEICNIQWFQQHALIIKSRLNVWLTNLIQNNQGTR
jgi:hypothetical protein